jgi:hypothetical protein
MSDNPEPFAVRIYPIGGTHKSPYSEGVFQVSGEECFL